MADFADRTKKDTKGRASAAERLLAQLLEVGGHQRCQELGFTIHKIGEGVGVEVGDASVWVVYKDDTFKLIKGDTEVGKIDLPYDPHQREFVSRPPRSELDKPQPPLAQLVAAALRAATRDPNPDSDNFA
jgi:hypothetical protein